MSHTTVNRVIRETKVQRGGIRVVRIVSRGATGPTGDQGAGSVEAITTAGTSAALTYTSSGDAITALTDGLSVTLIAHATANAAATLKLDATLAKTIAKPDVSTPGSYVNIGADDVIQGSAYRAHYDSSEDKFILEHEGWQDFGALVDDLTPQAGGDIDMNGHTMFWARGANVASASDLALLTDGNVIAVTGTVTINSIDLTNDLWKVGSIIVISFTGAVQLTHNASQLVLLGGANITTSADDHAVFRKQSATKWFMVSYGNSLAGLTGGTAANNLAQLDGSGNLPTGIGIPLQEAYASSGQTIISAGLLTLAHGLSAKPKLISFYIKCTDAGGEGGYSQDDEVKVEIVDNSDTVTLRLNGVYFDGTNVYVRFTSTATVFAVGNKSTGGNVSLTNSKWDLYVEAWA